MPLSCLERRESPEFVKALIDLSSRQCSKTFNPELLATKTSHHRAVDYGTMQLIDINMAVLEIKSALGQVADESTCKAIACASGIEYIFQQVAGHHE